MNAKPSDAKPAALITGASAGLGLEIARVMISDGYRVALVGRDKERLESAAGAIQTGQDADVITVVCDVTDRDQTTLLAMQVTESFGRLDALINCVGTSDRGLACEITPQRLHELIDQNVVSVLNCSSALLELLKESRGAIVNIGSLAGKVGARYLGGYNAAKHAVAGLTQQMRLELADDDVHVALVSPGPIRRTDAGSRYNDQVDGSIPASAAAPGGGTKVKGIAPEKVARAVLACARRKRTDVILPGYLRILITIGNAWPSLGDWLLKKFTSQRKN